MSKPRTRTVSRRTFLAGTAAAGITIVKASQVRGSEANSKVRIGLIGCGGRGRWIARLFVKHGGYSIAAIADYFPAQVEFVGNEQKVPENKRFTTLSGYKRLLEQDLDAVVIETPPYFHPEQAAAAVDAGRHVYVAKPIAVDVPGCLTIGESAKKAAEKKRVFLVDFQTRADPYYREAVKRVHAGDIGKLVCGEARYPWAHDPSKPVSTPEERLKFWYGTTALAGDFIVEQNIHALDVAAWIAAADPVKASGTCVKGKYGRHGDISDAFSASLTFPNDLVVTYHGVQCTPGTPDLIHCRYYGTDGIIDTDYYSHVWIKGKKPYEGKEFPENIYTSGTVINIAEFHQAIQKGDVANATAPQSVRSNLTAILAREACYRGGELSWSDLIKANKKLEPDLSGLKS